MLVKKKVSKRPAFAGRFFFRTTENHRGAQSSFPVLWVVQK